MADPSPQGMAAVFTDRLGRVIESVADFTTDGYGGFSLRDAQTYRVRQQLYRAVIEAYCSEMIVDGIDATMAAKIVQNLVKKGATVTFIPIGYPKDD